MLRFIVFPPCPGGVLCPRSYQSVAIYRVPPPAQAESCALAETKVSLFMVLSPPPPAQVGSCALGFTKVSLFIVFPPMPRRGLSPPELPNCHYLSCPPSCPGEVLRPRNCRSVAVYRVPTLTNTKQSEWKGLGQQNHLIGRK